MSLTKEITDKKVNFEFNKEFINLFSKKIKDNDTNFLNRTLKELHPSDSADIIENLVPENRSKLIELEGFYLDPEIFIVLNESIQAEIFIILSIESIAGPEINLKNIIPMIMANAMPRFLLFDFLKFFRM